jgi:CBS domain-containing protein
MTVNQILSAGNVVHSIVSSITVYEALKVMGEKNVGAVLVIEDNLLKGVLSERDSRKIVLKQSFQRYLVHEIMARDVITVKPTDNLDYCMELMSTKRIRHLPVLENNGFGCDFDRGCSEVYHRNTKKKQFSIWILILVGKNHNYIYYQSK